MRRDHRHDPAAPTAEAGTLDGQDTTAGANRVTGLATVSVTPWKRGCEVLGTDGGA